MTIVCGDSHTATHGAFGALAFGIGTSEVEHVLATQCLLQKKPKTYEVRVDGKLKPGVSAKDIILALIAKIGVGGGTGHVFEYTGEAIRGLTMEQRMTICNMSIEGGARAGMIAPDETTLNISKAANSPPRRGLGQSRCQVETLPSDEGATYDKSITLNAADLEPMITYGTNPGMGMKITTAFPTVDHSAKPRRKPPSKKRCLHGPSARSIPARSKSGCGLHRLLHQLAHLRPAPGGGHAERARKVAMDCASWSCPARRMSRNRPKPKDWTKSSKKPAPNGAKRAAVCVLR
jgi:3-isopropylmalate dehydratase large subunit